MPALKRVTLDPACFFEFCFLASERLASINPPTVASDPLPEPAVASALAIQEQDQTKERSIPVDFWRADAADEIVSPPLAPLTCRWSPTASACLFSSPR